MDLLNVSYGCEIPSLAQKKKRHRFTVFVNRVLRRICGTDKGDVTEG
jgi:hypothetical protein